MNGSGKSPLAIASVAMIWSSSRRWIASASLSHDRRSQSLPFMFQEAIPNLLRLSHSNRAVFDHRYRISVPEKCKCPGPSTYLPRCVPFASRQPKTIGVDSDRFVCEFYVMLTGSVTLPSPSPRPKAGNHHHLPPSQMAPPRSTTTTTATGCGTCGSAFSDEIAAGDQATASITRIIVTHGVNITSLTVSGLPNAPSVQHVWRCSIPAPWGWAA